MARLGEHDPVFIGATRTPFLLPKEFDVEDLDALPLVSCVVNGLFENIECDPLAVDDFFFGKSVFAFESGHFAKDLSLDLGLSKSLTAQTVQRGSLSAFTAFCLGCDSVRMKKRELCLISGADILRDFFSIQNPESKKFISKFLNAKKQSSKINVLKNYTAKFLLQQDEGFLSLPMAESCQNAAHSFSIKRDDQDRYTSLSFKKASDFTTSHPKKTGIKPLWISPRFSNSIEEDSNLSSNLSFESISGLPPLFNKKYGTLTHGNSAALTDGAGAAFVCSYGKSQQLGVEPSLKILDYECIALDQESICFSGYLKAIHKICSRNNLTLADIGTFEVNENFAAQMLIFFKMLDSKSLFKTYMGFDWDHKWKADNRVNPFGGSLAFGDSFGGSFFRQLLHLQFALETASSPLGVLAQCSHGGFSGALLVERI